MARSASHRAIAAPANMKSSKNTLTAESADPLRNAIAGLYHVFRGYRAPSTKLDVCLYCCMDAKLEAEMRTQPLRSLYRQHFYEYNTSAKSPAQPVDEVKYFIPRMCELLAEGIDIHHSIELYLNRVGRCPQDSFDAAERKALNAFALAFFTDGLRQPLYMDGGLFQRDDALSILLMFHLGGINIEPLLAHWERDAAREAAVHFAYIAYWDYWYEGGVVTNAFAEDQLEFRQKVEAWLTCERVRTFSHRESWNLQRNRPPSGWGNRTTAAGQMSGC